MPSMRKWIRQMLAARPPIRKPDSRTWLNLESLEDRAVPAFLASVALTTVSFTDTSANEQLWLRVGGGGNLEYSTVNGAAGIPGAYTDTGLSAASVTAITINSASNLNVDTVYLNDTSLTTTAFPNLTSVVQVNGSSGAVAVQTGTHANALSVGYQYTGPNTYDVFSGVVNSGSKLSVFYDGVHLGEVDDVILGTSNHDDGFPHPPVLNGTAQDDLIFGFGGNDIINGGAGNDIIVGGAGNDTLNGDAGDDTFVYRGAAEGYDTLDGGADTNRMLAVGAGTVIGVTHLNGTLGPVLNETIQKIEGSSSGDTIVGSPTSVHSVLNFTNVELEDIAEIDAAGTTANNTIYVSTLSDATYRGNGGNDVFHLKGAKTVTLPYSGSSNGFDTYVDDGYTGIATAVAETTGTVIGVANYNNQLDAFVGHSSGDTIIRASDSVHDSLNFANTPLTNIARVESGAGNDVVTTSLLNRTAALTYDGGSYTGDQLRLTVTAAEASANAAAIAADIAAIQAAILSGWSGGPLALTFFKFSVINFESVTLLVI